MLIWKIAARYETRNQAYLMAIKLSAHNIPYQVNKIHKDYTILVPEGLLEKAQTIIKEYEDKQKEQTKAKEST